MSESCEARYALALAIAFAVAAESGGTSEQALRSADDCCAGARAGDVASIVTEARRKASWCGRAMVGETTPDRGLRKVALANGSGRSYFPIVKNGIYVVMGVSGSGKSLIGAKLAHALDFEFIEGDDLHSSENIERMSSGIPLTDADRMDWLRTMSQLIRDADDEGAGVVISCSALKRAYRDILRSEGRRVQFIFLEGESSLIADRIANRGGAHFMSPSLLESQFATLEKPMPDEDAWVIDISSSPDEIITDLLARAQGENR